MSRTFGDIEAKRVKYGGNPKVVIASPDIKSFKIEENYDFIVLGCDGIFDKLNNLEVIQAAWEASKRKFTNRGQMIHQNCGLAVEAILKSSIAERSLDNVTVVFIAFKNYRKALKVEIDKFEMDLKKQNQERITGRVSDNVSQSNTIDEDAAEQIENKRMNNSNDRSKESGIQISKTLNLPNYDVTLSDIEI